MATREACEAAVRELVDRLGAVDADVRGRYVVERSVSCTVSDLAVTFVGRLGEEGLQEVSTEEAERAQVRLAVSSDDLVALVEGRLAIAAAWATGRLRVQASPMDLLRLRSLL